MDMRSRVLMVSALVFALSAPSVRAQQGTVITGQVTTKTDGLSLPAATVSIPSLNIAAVTDQEGRYTLNVPATAVRGQLVEVQTTFAGLAPASSQIRLTPGTITHDVAMTLSFAEEITVGSRAPGAEAEKAVPVDVLTAKQIESIGATETMQVIQRLAPSFNFPRPTISDGTDAVRPATLRGLWPDQVLVLVNGKRRHQTALVNVNQTIGRGSTAVDLNAIPVSAIERVEILRDGAAAQYGSDAIAGVINIVLKSGASPPSASFRVGGNQGTFSDVFGVEHDFTDGGTYDAGGSYGLNVGNGTITAAAEFRDRKGTNRAGPDVGDQLRAGDASNNPVPQPNIHWGDSKERDALAFANAEFPLNEQKTTTFYLFGGYSHRFSSAGGNYRRAIDAGDWPQIYPLGFLPLIEPIIIDGSASAGVRGIQSKWFWDANAEFGHDHIDFFVRNSLNVSLGPTIPPNQTEFYSGGMAFNQFVTTFDTARPFDVGIAGPLNVAFGAEYRRENYRIEAGEPASYSDGGRPNQFGQPGTPGAQVFPGFRPSNELSQNRDNGAGYIDVEGDFVPRVRLGFAGRYEHYSDFGNTTNGKLTARLEAHKRVVFRGALSTGFRAPSLGQEYFNTVSTNFTLINGVFVPLEVGTYPVSSPQARVLGATDLEPETSRNYSGGIVLNPIDPLDITADFYRIDIDDRVVLTDNFTGARIAALLAPFAANSARFFSNAIDTSTKGVDLIANFTRTLQPASVLRMQAAYNHTTTSIERVSPTPPQLAGFENILFGEQSRRLYTCGQPTDNLRLTEDWQRGRAGVVVREARYGTFCSIEAADQTFGAKWLTDAEVAYRFGKQTLAFGVENLFNVFPDPNIPATANRGTRTFPRNAPFGFNGRYVYGRLSLSM
jgi:iron complex outermembrane receptor protein